MPSSRWIPAAAVGGQPVVLFDGLPQRLLLPGQILLDIQVQLGAEQPPQDVLPLLLLGEQQPQKLPLGEHAQLLELGIGQPQDVLQCAE